MALDILEELQVTGHAGGLTVQWLQRIPQKARRVLLVDDQEGIRSITEQAPKLEPTLL